MTNNPEMQRQFDAAKQMAAQSGIGGAIYLDVDQANGSLRLKFKVTPVEEQAKLVSSLAYVIAQMSQSFGLQVNVRERKNEEASHG
jgi:hypothetical protein